MNTLILRHRRENLKKCSLTGLESRSDISFFTYPKDTLPSLHGYLMLSMDGEDLSLKDRDLNIFLIDSTWRYAPVMEKSIDTTPLIMRKIPSHFRTAYPRRQDDCPDPELGLASVEALYLAYFLTGRDPKGLLNHYYWKDSFLKLNHLPLLDLLRN